jgi:hypothetical protein
LPQQPYRADLDALEIPATRKPRRLTGIAAGMPKEDYLAMLSFFMVSFDVSVFMLSLNFMLFFFVCFILALASMGCRAFMESWVVGPAVWADATETVPMRAAQHATISRFRILVSCWIKSPRKMSTAGFGSIVPPHNCRFPTRIKYGQAFV